MSGSNVETLKRSGVAQLLSLAAAEGWNPGVGDVAAFQAADPDGFLGVHDRESLVAGISVVRLDARNGFLGLYIVDPARRGQGHGFALWQEALQRLADRGVVSVGLDGVVEQQANYRRSGFEFLHRNLRFVGPAEQLSGVTGTARDRGLSVAVMSAEDRASAKLLDRATGSVARDAFLDAWLVDRDCRHSLCARDASGALGFATVRRCLDGWKIGPLIASTRAVAEHLIAALVDIALANAGSAGSPDGPGATTFTIDVPEANAPAIHLLEEAGFEQTFETARMYRGPAPAIDTARLWGVATLELG